MPTPKRILCLLIGLMLGGPAALQAQEGPTGTIRGTLTEASGQPLAGATVKLPALQQGTYTNKDGIFVISKVDTGRRRVVFAYPGYDTTSIQVRVKPNATVKRDIVLSQVLQTEGIEIVGKDDAKIDTRTADPGITEVSARDIERIPSLGNADLAQYLQTLPGVVFTGDQGGQLFVRGGTPIQNLVMMDGAIMYKPFHSIGLFSVFDTDYIQGVDVYSGGFPAEYGGRVSSVMDISTREGNFKRFSGKVSATPIMSSALVEGPLFGKGGPDERANSSFLLSARRSYLDGVSQSVYNYVNDTAGLPFSFTDLYGKVTFGNGSNKFTVFGFHQTDDVNYEFPSNLSWRSSGGGMYFRVLPNNTQMILSGNFAVSDYENEQDNPSETFPRQSSIGGFNGRLDFTYILNSVDELSYGLQLLGFSNDFQITNSLGLRTERSGNNTEFVGYAQYKKVFREKQVEPNGDFSYFNRAVLEPSLRAHFYNNQSQVSLEPRLRAKLNFERLSFQAAGGVYSQNLVSSVSDRDVVQLFQGFLSAPDLRDSVAQLDTDLQRALHGVAGIEFEIMRGVKLNLEAWYKDFRQVTNINRNRRFPDDPDFIGERGEAFGADLILRYNRGPLYGYLTYGLSKVTRTTPGGETYPPVFDRRHNVKFVGNYRLGRINDKRGRKLTSKWEFSARWQLGTGFPFTQTQGFYEKLDFSRQGSGTNYVDQNGNLGLLLAPDLNGGRLPAYHRLDLSVRRRFALGGFAYLEANLNAINTYNRNNIFYFDRVSFERVNQLPIMPTAGLKLEF
jgi:hypothetical protein